VVYPPPSPTKRKSRSASLIATTPPPSPNRLEGKGKNDTPCSPATENLSYVMWGRASVKKSVFRGFETWRARENKGSRRLFQTAGAKLN